jgi:hypothetical protein
MTSTDPQAEPERPHPLALAEDVILDLIAQGFETEELDYKNYFDPSDRDSVIEVIKDVAAMQAMGGYLLFGVDNSGNVTGSLDSVDPRLFDETSMRAKFEKHFDGFLSLSVRTITVQGKKVVAVYMEPHPHGFAIIKADVEKGGKIKYRAGDVFVRHGTASVRGQHDDIAKVRASLLARKRAEWIREVRSGNVDSGQMVASSKEVSAPAATLGWHLDAEELSAIVVEQLRRSDDIPVRLLLQDSVWDIFEALKRDNGKGSVTLLLDRMAALLTLFLRLGRRDLYALGIDSLHAAYMSPRDLSGNYRHEMRVDPPEFWLNIYEVIAIVGAVATKLEDWASLRLLILQEASFEG